MQRALHTHAILRALRYPDQLFDPETLEDCARAPFIDQLAVLHSTHGPALPVVQAWLPAITTDPMRALWASMTADLLDMHTILQHAAAVRNDVVQHAVHRFLAITFPADAAVPALLATNARMLQVQVECADQCRLLPELLGPRFDHPYYSFLGVNLQLSPAFSDKRWVHAMFASCLHPATTPALGEVCSDIVALFRKYRQSVSVEAMTYTVHMWRARAPTGYSMPCVKATLANAVRQSPNGGFTQCVILGNGSLDNRWLLRLLQEPYTRPFNEAFLTQFEWQASVTHTVWQPLIVSMVGCVLQSPAADASVVLAWKARLVAAVVLALQCGVVSARQGDSEVVNTLLRACATDGHLTLQSGQLAEVHRWFAAQRLGRVPELSSPVPPSDGPDGPDGPDGGETSHEAQDRKVLLLAASKLRQAVGRVRARAGAVVITTASSTRRGTLVTQRHQSLWDMHKNPVVVRPKTALHKSIMESRTYQKSSYPSLSPCPDVFVMQVGGQCYLGAMLNVVLGHPLTRFMFVGYAEHANDAVFETLLSGAGIRRTMATNYSAMLQMVVVSQAMRGSDDLPDATMSDTLTELEAAARGSSVREQGGWSWLVSPFIMHIGGFQVATDPNSLSGAEFLVPRPLYSESPLKDMHLMYAPHWHFVGALLETQSYMGNSHMVALVRCSNQPGKAFIVDSNKPTPTLLDWDSTTPASLGLSSAQGIYMATYVVDSLLSTRGAKAVFAKLEDTFLNGQKRTPGSKWNLL
jgi:hypothetical protein